MHRTNAAKEPEPPQRKGQHYGGSRGNIAVCHNAEAAQPHQGLHLGDQVPHGLFQLFGGRFNQGGIAGKAVITEGQVLCGLQAAQFIQAALLQGVQPLIRQVAFSIKQGFVIKWGVIFVLRKHCLFHHSCLLSMICLRRIAFARNSWF